MRSAIFEIYIEDVIRNQLVLHQLKVYETLPDRIGNFSCGTVSFALQNLGW